MTDDHNLAVLALDAAGSSCSAALWRAGRVVARRFADMSHGQAEALIPMVQAVMAEAGLGYDALDLIAASTGPGSYTGVRVGLAAAQALASAAGKPLSGVSSFDAIRAATATSGPLLIALDTRRADFYVQRFDTDGQALTPPAIVTEQGLAGFGASGTPIYVAGDAAERAVALLQDAGHDARQADGPTQADAAWIAAVAADRWMREGTPRPAQPIYLRPPDAKTVAQRAQDRAQTPVRLVPCSPVHGAVLARLQHRCFDERWSAEAMTTLLSQPGVVGVVLIADETEIPMGYGLARAVGDEAEILSFGVDPRYRRAGHGARLLTELRARTEQLGAATLFLEVADSNSAARALYESQGFSVAGRRVGYYRGPRGVEDALTYRLDLAKPQLS